ncbi:MAG: iron export ABC transporter permease subunit FetB [Proteobacteria bacterium]|nr:iron export ABC transporter permease subunit FetB [Pseudomonadota bacterium]
MLIQLTVTKLWLAFSLIVLLMGSSYLLKLRLEKTIFISALRTVLQLSLIGIVLESLFSNVDLHWVILISLIMLSVAGREVMNRQTRKVKGAAGYWFGTSAMFVSSFTVTVFALAIIISPQPWYTPQYSIPLLGMILGNTMNGIAISLDRLTQSVWSQKQLIEQKLILGYPAKDAIQTQRNEAITSGLIPIINSMATAGLVSLPGMMTGQILAGNTPGDAVKYQIMIMFLIAFGTGMGVFVAVLLTSRHMFDSRDRLRLDRLSK